MNNLFKYVWMGLNYSHKGSKWVECFVYISDHMIYIPSGGCGYPTAVLSSEDSEYMCTKYADDMDTELDAFFAVQRLYYEYDEAQYR